MWDASLCAWNLPGSGSLALTALRPLCIRCLLSLFVSIHAFLRMIVQSMSQPAQQSLGLTADQLACSNASQGLQSMIISMSSSSLAYHGQAASPAAFHVKAIPCRCIQVAANKLWATVGRRFNPPSTMTDLSFVFKRNFVQALSAFEQVRLLHSSGPLHSLLSSCGSFIIVHSAHRKLPFHYHTIPHLSRFLSPSFLSLTQPQFPFPWVPASTGPSVSLLIIGHQEQDEDIGMCLHGQVAQYSLWAEVGRTFRPPPTMTALSFIFKRNYTQALLEFEKVDAMPCLTIQSSHCCGHDPSGICRIPVILPCHVKLWSCWLHRHKAGNSNRQSRAFQQSMLLCAQHPEPHCHHMQPFLLQYALAVGARPHRAITAGHSSSH